MEGLGLGNLECPISRILITLAVACQTFRCVQQRRFLPHNPELDLRLRLLNNDYGVGGLTTLLRGQLCACGVSALAPDLVQKCAHLAELEVGARLGTRVLLLDLVVVDALVVHQGSLLL